MMWDDGKRYNNFVCSVGIFGPFVLFVYRVDKNSYYVSCYDLFDAFPLMAKDFHEAKLQAVEKLRASLKYTIDELDIYDKI